MLTQCLAAAVLVLSLHADGHRAGDDDRAVHAAPEAATVMDSGSWVLRVGGEASGELVTREGPEGPLYSAGVCATDTKLPVGYPAPTPPGAIELKHYASVRRAEFTGEGGRRMGGVRGFWPLFRHIQRNDIAMTAPVEMEERDTDDDGDTDAYTMTFLYHTTDDGPTGADGDIAVVDTEPETWLAIGVQGRTGAADDHIAALDAWLDAQDDWTRIGQPRTLGYNGPNIPPARQWWEVQVQVERVGDDDDAGDGDDG